MTRLGSIQSLCLWSLIDCVYDTVCELRLSETECTCDVAQPMVRYP